MRSNMRAAAAAAALLVILVLVSSASARPRAAAAIDLRAPAFGPITSGFGGARGHEGVDYGKLRRLGIVAAARGRVLRTGYVAGYAGYGKIVLIAHRNGFRTLYAHLSRVRVRPGKLVRSGSWIGTAGCTGRCSGTHLHFELHRNGRPLNPIRFLG